MAIKSTADKVATIQKGYTLDGATIELGAAIVEEFQPRGDVVALDRAAFRQRLPEPPQCGWGI